MSLVKKLFGVKVVQPMSTMTCERVACGSETWLDTLYEVTPGGRLEKRGCC